MHPFPRLLLPSLALMLLTLSLSGCGIDKNAPGPSPAKQQAEVSKTDSSSDNPLNAEDQPKSPAAQEIVFLIDASDSMVEVLPFVVNQVKGAVGQLQKKQRVTIVIFSGEGIYEVPGGGGVKGLRPVTVKFKQDIDHWLSLENHKYKIGGRDGRHAAAAIQEVLSYKPQLVFVLSNNLVGVGQGVPQHKLIQDNLMKEIHKANDADSPTRFYALHFLDEDRLVRAGLKGTLQRLADETGGTYRFISAQDLNLN